MINQRKLILNSIEYSAAVTYSLFTASRRENQTKVKFWVIILFDWPNYDCNHLNGKVIETTREGNRIIVERIMHSWRNQKITQNNFHFISSSFFFVFVFRCFIFGFLTFYFLSFSLESSSFDANHHFIPFSWSMRTNHILSVLQSPAQPSNDVKEECHMMKRNEIVSSDEIFEIN